MAFRSVKNSSWYQQLIGSTSREVSNMRENDLSKKMGMHESEPAPKS